MTNTTIYLPVLIGKEKPKYEDQFYTDFGLTYFEFLDEDDKYINESDHRWYYKTESDDIEICEPTFWLKPISLEDLLNELSLCILEHYDIIYRDDEKLYCLPGQTQHLYYHDELVKDFSKEKVMSKEQTELHESWEKSTETNYEFATPDTAYVGGARDFQQEAIRALEEAWQAVPDKTDYDKGILQGLDMAIEIIKNLEAPKE